jgi:hypothetical protein
MTQACALVADFDVSKLPLGYSYRLITQPQIIEDGDEAEIGNAFEI